MLKKIRVKGTSLIRNPSPLLNHSGHFKAIGTTEGPLSSVRLHNSSMLKHTDMRQQHLLPSSLFCPALQLTSSLPCGESLPASTAMSAFPMGWTQRSLIPITHPQHEGQMPAQLHLPVYLQKLALPGTCGCCRMLTLPFCGRGEFSFIFEVHLSKGQSEKQRRVSTGGQKMAKRRDGT